jgi:hypothetical protein
VAREVAMGSEDVLVEIHPTSSASAASSTAHSTNTASRACTESNHFDLSMSVLYTLYLATGGKVTMGSEDVLVEIHPRELRFGGIFHSAVETTRKTK